MVFFFHLTALMIDKLLIMGQPLIILNVSDLYL